MKPPVQLTPIRALLVDDSAAVRSRFRSLIEEAGPVEIVGEAGTVAVARIVFHTQRPDAVVLDLGLAGGEAVAFLAEIKQARPACVVIMLSNPALPESRDYCRQLGADYFFDKSREFERVPEVLMALRRGTAGDGVGTI